MASPEHLRYVRVQDDLHGMDVDAEGRVQLIFPEDAARNTVHFAINGVVGDHAYGRFNQHADGSLKGKIVIIAHPDDMATPAGLNQVDTWWRMGATKNEDGTFARRLDVGHARIVVPVGTRVPKTMDAVFYDGTIEGRDKAVAEVLASEHVVQRGIGFRSWTDSSEAEAPTWARETTKALYGNDAESIHIGMHDTSMDAVVESVGIGHRVEDFRNARALTFVDDNGVSQNYIEAIEKRHRMGRAALDALVLSLSVEQYATSGAFYEEARVQLDRDLAQAHVVQGQVAAREDARIAKFVAIEDALGALAPTGEIYLADANAAGMQKLSVQEFTEQLMASRIALERRVWVQGVTPDWQPIGVSPLRHVFLASLAPLPTHSAVAPPLFPEQPRVQQAAEALRALSAALERQEDVAMLGEMLHDAVEKAALGVQESQASASQGTLTSLATMSATIKGLAILDGDMGTVARVEAAVLLVDNALQPVRSSSVAKTSVEPELEFAF